MSTLADIVAQLESGGGANVSSQPSSMVNPIYGQYAGFVNQYGSGATGIDNYAQQMLSANPNATLGDFYSSYVLGTGNPKSTYNVGDLASLYPSAYSNLIKNAGYTPSTPLGSLFGSSTSDSSSSSMGGGIVGQLGQAWNWLFPDLGQVAKDTAKGAATGTLGVAKSTIDYAGQLLFSSRMMMLVVGVILVGTGALGLVWQHGETIIEGAGSAGAKAQRLASAAGIASI